MDKKLKSNYKTIQLLLASISDEHKQIKFVMQQVVSLIYYDLEYFEKVPERVAAHGSSDGITEEEEIDS